MWIRLPSERPGFTGYLPMPVGSGGPLGGPLFPPAVDASEVAQAWVSELPDLTVSTKMSIEPAVSTNGQEQQENQSQGNSLFDTPDVVSTVDTHLSCSLQCLEDSNSTSSASSFASPPVEQLGSAALESGATRSLPQGYSPPQPEVAVKTHVLDPLQDDCSLPVCAMATTTPVADHIDVPSSASEQSGLPCIHNS